MKRRASLATALLVPALLLAACGTSDSDGGEGGGGGAAPEANTDVSGSITISGSSTVEPITALVREEYIAQNDAVDISVDGPGTGDGFALFCEGDTDISDASRPIKEEEATTCADNDIEFIELKVGIDGISVITNEANELECLSFQDLYALVGPESEGFENWTDASDLAGELGSDTEFPDENLIVTAPGAESGTFDSFVELVIESAGEARVESGAISEDDVAAARDDYSAQPDDNAIIESAQSDPGGLGWVGFAFADQAEGVKKMPISEEPGGDCVEPTQETIQDTSYPISRDLFIYVNKAKAEENEALPAFVDFYLAGLTDFVEASDYIALADDSETLDVWENRTTGTREG
ncbi:MAG: substrate-binding domain-containing protein [Acidimicrobiales bacterium]|nr:substrate-binding domain-containing protein [Acidimicrobiales bacterium]